jgi:hypothetical protein
MTVPNLRGADMKRRELIERSLVAVDAASRMAALQISRTRHRPPKGL